MALADFIDSGNRTPGWVKQRAWWWTMFRLGAVLLDGLIEGVYQGRRAGMPDAIDVPGVPGLGGFEDGKSLDYIGHDRGVLHGLTESLAAYAYRLRHWKDPAAGGWGAPGIFGMLEQLAGVLAGNGQLAPLMRIVATDGSWWTRYPSGVYELARVNGEGFTYNADGTTTPLATAAHAWDWDSATVPATLDQGFVGRWWLILYMPINTPYGTAFADTFQDGDVFGHQWNSHTALGQEPDPWAATWGSNAPSALVALVFGVITQRQVVGFQCSHVIYASDPASFAPDGSSAAPALGTTYPDGHWGWSSKYDSGTNTRIIARNSSAVYWRLPLDIE